MLQQTQKLHFYFSWTLKQYEPVLPIDCVKQTLLIFTVLQCTHAWGKKHRNELSLLFEVI